MMSIDEIAERAARDLRADVRGVSNVEAGLASIQGSPVKSAPQRRRWSRWIVATSMVAAAGVAIAVVIARDDGKQQIVPVDVATTDDAKTEAPTSVETTLVTTDLAPAILCDTAALLSAVQSALPAEWTSVTVEACRDRFVQFVAIADQSSCPSDVTECRENQRVWMAYVDGKWLLIDAGTGIGCEVERDITPTLEKSCEALFPSGVDGEVLRYPYPSTDGVGMAAQIKGVLELDGACLYVKTAETGERYPILWPAGTTWDAENTFVIPPGGKPIPVGAKVDGTGGFLNVSTIATLADSDAYQRALECVDNTYDEVAVVNNQPDAIARGA